MGLPTIEAFDNSNTRMVASHAGTRCGMTRSAVRRYLLALVTSTAIWLD